MELSLKDKRVLVTGGTRGVGQATVRALAAAGARVVTCYHGDRAPAQDLLAELNGDGRHRVVRADVTDEADAARLIDTCRDALGGLDVVVNNVGVDGQVAFADLTDAEWHRIIDTNLTGCFLVTRAAVPVLSDGGSVINIGASVALRGRVNGAHYTASKAALIGLTRSLAKELGRRGIRVNTIAPGLIETQPGAGLPPPVVARIRAMTSLGSLGTPTDVAGAVLFLASDLSNYVTGVTLNVDGGM
jgi:3-oxoacyl-[acyl-carrier protein] reductase